MKKVMILVMAFVILSSIAIAQQTTISNPQELAQIFSYRQDNETLQLYTTIRNREISLGDLSGNIIAQLPVNVTARNAEYNVVTEEALITIKGELTITKPESGSIYPKILLFNGTIQTKEMIFTCGSGCETIRVDPNLMALSVKGEGMVSKDIDYSIEEDKVVLTNIIVKPLFLADETIVQLDFRVPNQTNYSRLGRMRLGPNNKGEYLIGSVLRPIIQKLSYREEISGDVNILEFINPLEEERLIHNEGDQNLIVNVNNNELFKLNKGFIDYVNYDSFSYNCLLTSSLSCLYLDKNERKALLTIRSETTLEFNSNNPAISSIEILPFQPNDRESKLVLYNPNLGNRKIIFNRDNVIADGNWHDFGISFKTQIYSPQERRFDTLECKYQENKCYLNNIEIILRPQFQELARCNQNSDCGERGICESNRCVQQNECRTIIEGENTDPISAGNINILFIGDGITNQNELEQVVNRLINNRDGLFSKEPFRSNQNKFNIMIKTLPSATINENRRPDIDSIDLSNCPEADLKIIVSRRQFVSDGNRFLKVCRISMQTEGPEDQRRFIHELGHCFGSLEDEYYFSGARSQIAWAANCIGPSQGKSATDIAKETWARLIIQEPGMTRERSLSEAENLANQASADWKSCGGYCTTVCQNYLRPSENSIMNKYYLPTQEAEEFNRISKLHLQNVINRNTILQLD